MALNENIRARRMQLKLSQEYVADQLGISRQAVAKWESGKSTPTAANLAGLAALFEMNISELVEPENYVLKQKKQEEQVKKTQKNIKMHVGHAGALMIFSIFILPQCLLIRRAFANFCQTQLLPFVL